MSDLFHFFITYRPEQLEDGAINGASDRQTRKLGPFHISHQHLHPEPFFQDDAHRQVLVLGHPILGDRIQREAVADRLQRRGVEDDWIRNVNGCFLVFVYDDRAGTMSIVNDRFASIPFFYALDEGLFFGSLQYADLWRTLDEQNRREIDENSVFEFLYFKRLLGNRTLDRASQFLDSASILKLATGNGVGVEKEEQTRYWTPQFEDDPRSSADDLSDQLARALKRSVSRKTSDRKSYGHLLSGGLDSRLVLAASDAHMTCYTVGDHRNLEVEVAEKIARCNDCEHVFLQRPDGYYGQILDRAVELTGGMYNFDHCHFFHALEVIRERSDVLFHGHGFDYFFQGMYLPSERRTFLGRNTFISHLKDVDEDDLVREYMAKTKLRQKNLDVFDLVKSDHSSALRNFLTDHLHDLLADARQASSNVYNMWDYFHLHNLSRHYTYPNLLCLRSGIDERTICFDNDLYDVYLKIPPEWRNSSRVLRGALRKLSSATAQVTDANTNLPASYGPVRATGMHFFYRLLKKCGIWSDPPLLPDREDQSWPDRSQLVRSDPRLREKLEKIPEIGRLEQLSFLEMNRVNDYIDLHLQGRKDLGSFMIQLITLDQFLAR